MSGRFWVSPSGIKYPYDQTCPTCGVEMTVLEVFPNGLCVECHANTPAGQAVVEDLAAMWSKELFS